MRQVDAKDPHPKSPTGWKDANPGIAEVEDAKMRLAGLK